MRQSDIDLLLSVVKETRHIVDYEKLAIAKLDERIKILTKAVAQLTAKGPKVRYKKFLYEPRKKK